MANQFDQDCNPTEGKHVGLTIRGKFSCKCGGYVDNQPQPLGTTYAGANYEVHGDDRLTRYKLIIADMLYAARMLPAAEYRALLKIAARGDVTGTEPRDFAGTPDPLPAQTEPGLLAGDAMLLSSEDAERLQALASAPSPAPECAHEWTRLGDLKLDKPMPDGRNWWGIEICNLCRSWRYDDKILCPAPSLPTEGEGP